MPHTAGVISDPACGLRMGGRIFWLSLLEVKKTAAKIISCPILLSLKAEGGNQYG